MADKKPQTRRVPFEDVDPAPWLGRVGDGAVQPSGEALTRELRELLERAHNRPVSKRATHKK